MRRLVAIPAIVAAILLVSAAGANAAAASAQIVNCVGTTWCFSPNPITVAAGSTITWTNGTAPTHTATSDTNAWSTSNIAPGSTSGAIAFNTPGTFPYHCAIHPAMTGTIVVTAAATASASTAASRAPVVQRLAQGGGSPGLPIAAGLTLLGLGLLRLARSRRPRPSR